MTSFLLALQENRYCEFLRMVCKHLLMVISVLPVLLSLTTDLPAADKTPDETVPKAENAIRPERIQVVIVGAGMAGLTAAYFLKHRDIVLLEKTDHFGGIIASGSFGGFNYPKGPPYIGMPQGPIENMLTEMGLEPLEIPEPSEGFYYDGKFYFGKKGMARLFTEKSYASEYSRFVTTTTKLSKIYEDSDYSVLPNELAELDKISAEEWFKKEKLPTIFLEIYESQARGVFGVGLDQISALSFIPEIGSQFEPPDSDKEGGDLEQTEENPVVEKESGAFTFDNGLSELPEAIAKKLGDKVRLECNVTSIKLKNKLYEVRYADKAGVEYIIDADAVIIATPSPVSLEIGSDVLDEEQKRILGAINYCSYTTVAMFCSSPIFDRSFNLGVGNGFMFTDLYDSSWVQRAYDPALNKVQERTLCVYIPGGSQKNNSVDRLSDQDLVRKVVADLGRIFPDAGSKIVGHNVHRISLAYPIMRPGAYESIARLNDINQGTVLLAGDYMIYPTLEAAAESGYLAATKMDATLCGEHQVEAEPTR